MCVFVVTPDDGLAKSESKAQIGPGPVPSWAQATRMYSVPSALSLFEAHDLLTQPAENTPYLRSTKRRVAQPLAHSPLGMPNPPPALAWPGQTPSDAIVPGVSYGCSAMPRTYGVHVNGTVKRSWSGNVSPILR